MNNILESHPEISILWDYERNDPEKEYKMTSKAYWKCQKGHRWYKTISDQVRYKDKCYRCSHPNVEYLDSDYPDLQSWWDCSRNGGGIENIKAGSHKKACWICPEGHSFERPIREQVKKKNCPYCDGNKPILGETDFATEYPDAKIYWDYSKNKNDYPENYSKWSNKKKWWVCPHGHQWESTIGSFTRGLRCPYCSNKSVLKGFNDIKTTNPELMDIWNFDKNKISPEEITRASGKSVWWVCEKNHEWKTKVLNVSTNGSRCPYCSGVKSLKGFNDISTLAPYLIKEWNYKKNLFDPEDYTVGSEKYVWWICEQGHEWEACIKSRSQGNGCPHCSKTYNNSREELEVLDYIKSIIPNIPIEHGSRYVLGGKELDIYIPEKKMAIEYNGTFWHTEKYREDKLYHYKKWKECRDNDIQLITIWSDEWIENTSVVKNMLKHKLGENKKSQIYARKTVVEEVPTIIAESFFNLYHIQGYKRCSIYYGLYHNDNLVAVSGWTKNKHALYLDRYATSQPVVGGMGKLLKYGKRYAIEQGCDKIVTFADHCVSNGNLYEKLGFVYDGEVAPDYKYLVKGKRVHKFNYRKKRFKQDANLLYEDGLTEKQLADLNGLERIWDCGKTRYILSL